MRRSCGGWCISWPSPCRLSATVVTLVAPAGVGVAAAIVAVLALAPGMLTERWLFFAEAKHAVTLYYGR